MEERTEQARTEGSEAYGWLTVRVPAAELTATVDAVEELGEVTDLSISSEDVTRRGRDLDARIAARRRWGSRRPNTHHVSPR